MESISRLDSHNVEDVLALTPMQESMLYQYLVHPGSVQYFEQICYHVHGYIQVDLIKKAWEFVVETNEMLRTVYRWQGLRKPVQVVLKRLQIPVSQHDFSGVEYEERHNLLEELKVKDRNERIDIGMQPLRIILCKLSQNEYEMIISNHHIIYDGWSNVILLKEFLEAYVSYYYGREPERTIKNKYKEFIIWNRKKDRERQKDYWGWYLQGFKPKALFSSGINSSMGNNEEKYYEYVIQQELREKVMSFTRKNQVTLAALIYGVWGILLHKYSSMEDIVLGTTVSGRNPSIKGIEKMVGLFINTLPLRIKVNPDDGVMSFLSAINRSLLEREEFEYTSLADIITFSDLNSKGKIFDSVVVVQNYPLDEKLNRKDGIINIGLSSRFYMTKIDLTLGVRVFDSIILDFAYNTGVFSENNIKELSGAFIIIIQKIVEEVGKDAVDFKVKHIEVVDEHEKMKILSNILSNREKFEEIEEVDFNEIF